MRSRIALTIAVFGWIGFETSALQGACTVSATFTPLGNLDSNAVPAGSYATDVSADGTIVVGTSFFFDGETTQTRAFRWTAANGFKNLGLPPNTLSASAASAVNSTGSVVAGGVGFVLGNFLEIRNGAMWQGLGSPHPTVWDSVLISTDVSADGSVLVGTTRVPAPLPVPKQAFRRTAATGIVELGLLPGGSYSWADACSADGSVIVGYGDNPDHVTAIMWTEKTGVTTIPGLPDEPGQASGISPDGTIIVGYVNDQAYRAVSGKEVELIGKPEGSFSAHGLDVSADGSVIVGYAWYEFDTAAIIWTEAGGMRSLQQWLMDDAGVNLKGWTLLSSTGVSDDGRTIVGYGINPDGNWEAFVVKYSFAEDVNGNGEVDVDDLLAVINEWGPCDVPPASCAADITSNGEVDVDDLLAVINAWGACD